MQISFLDANQFGGELSLILALMKDHYKSQEKFQTCFGAAGISMCGSTAVNFMQNNGIRA